ncbi:exodeoxyribonuclease V subunit gamma [Shewanella maritima]|uniref:exodeoxyribonuclease V subunit gamma n=1 Tax=Shewanella maritima TaxID=2520507 RepID=UPI003735E502
MLKLIQSNQMEALSALLADFIATPIAGESLLTSEAVLVQSPGMSTWLRLEVAKHNQIAAALDFPLPSSFTWQLCHELLPDVPKDNAFTKAAMTWKLLNLLPQYLHDKDFAPLSQYLNLETQVETEELGPEQLNSGQLENIDRIKLYQLCGRIADIFDQYLVYRPQWILAWEQNQPLTDIQANLTLDENQLWQPKLWRALIDYNANALDASRYHRANLHADLIAALNNPATDISHLPKRLFVFGISSMPPQTLEVLYHLAGRIDVIMLSLSPCQHYWGDIVDPKVRARMSLQYANKKQLSEHWEATLEVGNPLLANNGKMGRELLDLLLSLPEAHTDFGDDCYIELSPDNLLRGVQYDILQMETLGQSLGPDAHFYQTTSKRRQLELTDDSITLRSCHSPLREVETLHDHILDMLASHPELEPKDIVIMMPDVASYAPYIDAVFGTANSQYFAQPHSEQQRENRYIPYAIADRGAAQESPLINSFLTLLNINQSRFGLTEVLSILEVPAILRRFQLDDEDLQLIRRWLDDANVRWGRDAQSRTELGLPAFTHNSWAFGIKRLILGYAMADDSPLYQHTLLVSGVEGQSAQALGKLLNFIELIDQYASQFNTELTAKVRLAQLQQMLDDFYQTEDDELNQIQSIREALSSLQTELEGAGHQGVIEIEIMRQWFNQRLSESRVGQRYLAGSVNFCTLMPMRSIPFKVVCLLGMNDGVYPRVQHPIGFDLMAHFGPVKGDRSRRLDDRYLFLEALLSARQQLYISYIGHSERDNTERLPSMLVSELLEFCQMSYLAPSLTNEDLSQVSTEALNQACLEHMLKVLPLQPFDRNLYQTTASLPHSYNAQWCPPNKEVAAQAAFFDRQLPIIPDAIKPLLSNGQHKDQGLDEGTAREVEIELSALIRFYRHPAQFFFNRTLQVELGNDIQADDNDEPFELAGLEKYLIQQQLIDSALLQPHNFAAAELINSLKASGKLPLAPFDDIMLSRFQKDTAPLIDRVKYLIDEEEPQAVDIDIALTLPAINIDTRATTNTADMESPTVDKTVLDKADLDKADLDKATQQVKHTLQLYGRVDNVYPKGLISYRPSTAHGKDIIQFYIRHLCLNASGIHKHSYLLDMGQFHSFAPLIKPQAQRLLTRLTTSFIHGQTQPVCLPPKTSFVYALTEGEHQQKLAKAVSQWQSTQTPFVEGNDPHNKRLFSFPEDFDKLQFQQMVTELLYPMISLYHVGKLAELDDFINTTAIEQHAKLTNLVDFSQSQQDANNVEAKQHD